MKKYRAVYELEDDGRWTVRVPQVRGCHSYGRTVEQARERIREALALFVEDASRVEITDDVRLPAEARRYVRKVQAARTRLNEDRKTLDVTQSKAAKFLKKNLGLSYRDAGAFLDLSHQRVEQLAKKTRA